LHNNIAEIRKNIANCTTTLQNAQQQITLQIAQQHCKIRKNIANCTTTLQIALHNCNYSLHEDGRGKDSKEFQSELMPKNKNAQKQNQEDGPQNQDDAQNQSS